MQLQGCVNKVFYWLPWPSGIVTVGVGIWWSGVEGFTSCIVYWYIVQFFNTFYLQQYLCIFYEVIKWITLHTSVFAGSWLIYFFFWQDGGILSDYPSGGDVTRERPTAHARRRVAGSCCCCCWSEPRCRLWCGWSNGVLLVTSGNGKMQFVSFTSQS